MNIRKHWKRLLLTTTALFWASCTSENENTFPTIGQDMSSAVEPGISSDSNIESSNENAAESSSSEAKAPSSSSAAESSSSSLNPNVYRLASNPSVTCTSSYINGGKCLDDDDAKSNKEAIQRKIDEYRKTVEENQTLTLEQLDSLEEKTIANLKEWLDADYKAFRTPKTHCTHVDLGTPIYKCSNNETYDATTLVTDYTEKLIYTKEAHKAKFPEKYQSSSSTEPSSSNSATPPSPLCQKHDFTAEQGLYDAYKKETKELVDIALKANEGSLREKDSLCLERIQESGLIPSETSEVIATKQTCDGETIVNPRYQQKLDTLKASVKKRIDKCIEYSKIEQIACDISAMCPDYGVDSKCTYKYSCNDGVSCRRTEGENDMKCTDKQGEEIKYTQEEFEKKYYTKSRY